METQTAAAPAKKNAQKDVQVMVNEIIIDQLEKGIVPWRAAWTDPGIPTGLISKKPYRGINILLLAPLGYQRNAFITMKQLEEIGGSAKPDEMPHVVTVWNYPNQTSGGKGQGKLTYYMVYNISQCIGTEDLSPDIFRETDPIKACERIISNLVSGPDIRYKEPTAFYDPLEDYINMPKMKTFGSPASYYAALFHELAHSTGHHTRLDRMGLVQMSEYGCSRYTMEELVTEIATNYLENLAGIPCSFTPDKEYIDAWTKKFSGDRYLIFNACALAQKAIDFILNVKTEDKPQEGE